MRTCWGDELTCREKGAHGEGTQGVLPPDPHPSTLYAEFLESVAAIYQDLLSGKNPNTVIVPTSSSGQHRQRPSTGEAGTPEGVEASLFYQCLENLCDRHKYR